MSVKYPIPEYIDEHEVIDLGDQGVWDIMFTGSREHDGILQNPELTCVSKGKFKLNEMVIEFKWMPTSTFVDMQATLVAECEECGVLDAAVMQRVFDEFVSSADLDYVRKIQKVMKSGTPYVAFLLEYFIGGTIIPFQEGRHRSLAALWNGVEKVPVWVFSVFPNATYPHTWSRK